MLLNVILKTKENRGDHAADIDVAINVTPEMTIGELVSKCFVVGIPGDIRTPGGIIGVDWTDHIEIRIAH